MLEDTATQPPGWYYAQGDPLGTRRFWDGAMWRGEAVVEVAIDGGVPVDTGVDGWTGASPGGEAVPVRRRAAGRVADQGAPVAAPWLRVMARSIDIVIWAGIAMLVAVPTGIAMAFFDQDELIRAIGVAAVAGAIAGYELLTVMTNGGTLGKRRLGLSVTAASIGGPAAARQRPGVSIRSDTAVRRVVPLLLYLLLAGTPMVGLALSVVLPVAGVVTMLGTANNQTPWDKLAGTVVVQTSIRPETGSYQAR